MALCLKNITFADLGAASYEKTYADLLQRACINPATPSKGSTLPSDEEVEAPRWIAVPRLNEPIKDPTRTPDGFPMFPNVPADEKQTRDSIDDLQSWKHALKKIDPEIAKAVEPYVENVKGQQTKGKYRPSIVEPGDQASKKVSEDIAKVKAQAKQAKLERDLQRQQKEYLLETAGGILPRLAENPSDGGFGTALSLVSPESGIAGFLPLVKEAAFSRLGVRYRGISILENLNNIDVQEHRLQKAGKSQQPFAKAA